MDHRHERFFLLALQHLFASAPDIGSRLLLEAGSARALFCGDRTARQHHFGERAALWERFREFDAWAAVGRAEERLAARGAQVIALTDACYPRLLREIPDPPPVLTAIGAFTGLSDAACVAMVGSRLASRHALEVALRMAEGLASRGWCVVSGMAYGIDSAAHRGALAAGKATVAVLGCGADVTYPPGNRRLACDIAGRGLLLSEFPPGAEPYPGNFPQRNRVISGLSLATIVVQAAEKSGSLITARFAAEQGRDVMAVPGPAGSPGVSGVHRLLRDGAALVEDAEEASELLLPLLARHPLLQRSGQLGGDVAKDSALYAILRNRGESSLEELVLHARISAEQALSGLMELAVAGLVEERPGSRWRIIRKTTPRGA